MTVYHGSTLEIKKPMISFSKRNLDFGCGFYVTSNEKQAQRWAGRKAMRFGGKPTVNLYEVVNLSEYNVKYFSEADEEWLNFVVKCRNGEEIYKQYDAVMGRVANDDIFRCVNMFMDGHWDARRTIREIKYYKNYDQIAFITQDILDCAVVFQEAYEVKR